MNKRTKATAISDKTKHEVIERDEICIFCKIGYHMPKENYYELFIKDPMHYIPKSLGGLGILQNLALGCRYHHQMVEHANINHREEMQGIFKEYLKELYPNWNEKDLYYKKWGHNEN